ncbi:MAG: peroxiredoxin [Planctomycetes bacterium]|nr:peroxiredoxin [Planctomycetota bacterium]MBI3844989.1 peroxiredoxin [Planctomycetota bacterium]
MADMIQVGKPAPDFTLKNQDGQEVKLSQFKGKNNVVLAFYPLDFSPVCSKEHVCFVSDHNKFDGVKAEVLGISVDSVWSHKAFAEKVGIKYPLLADFHPKGKVADSYGLYLADKGISARATVVVDKQGIVRYVKTEEIPQTRNNADIITALSKLN